eukprot:755589-Hanusia_phi.AAC.3
MSEQLSACIRQVYAFLLIPVQLEHAERLENGTGGVLLSDISILSSAEGASTINDEGIHILIDLNGHTSGDQILSSAYHQSSPLSPSPSLPISLRSCPQLHFFPCSLFPSLSRCFATARDIALLSFYSQHTHIRYSSFSLYGAGVRMEIFAYGPAPIVMHYMGFGATTGKLDLSASPSLP